MKNIQNNTGALPALLRTADGVDTLVTNSLCCAAAGIIAPSRATAEALIPHEKLRGAALADATLNAQDRPLAQPVVGYTPVSGQANSIREVGATYLPVDDLLTTDQVATALGLSSRTLAAWRSSRSNSLPYVKTGSRVRYRRQDVAAWLESRTFSVAKTASRIVFPTDSQLIEWLDQRGDLCCSIETSSITFWHEDSDTEGYKHVRDALIDAYQQDQANLSGGDA
ncbi:helix-turn-helix domain-containing protein [Pseudomonas proteolytica]|uniref:helix-turn-helix domain-containing protein n=1 Tax=Pseudomonas proteolytica TaxID=219574 RepID=UPI0030ED73E0